MAQFAAFDDVSIYIVKTLGLRVPFALVIRMCSLGRKLVKFVFLINIEAFQNDECVMIEIV